MTAPKAQLITPTNTPSTKTNCNTIPSEAPTARITPISRTRSRTFMLIVPDSPRPPTAARIIAIPNRKETRKSKALLRLACISDNVIVLLTSIPESPKISSYCGSV